MAKKQEIVQIEGLNAELQGLPSVAAQFARLNPSNPDFRQDEELLELNRLSRIYLKCLLNKAIESSGTEMGSLKDQLSAYMKLRRNDQKGSTGGTLDEQVRALNRCR